MFVQVFVLNDIFYKDLHLYKLSFNIVQIIKITNHNITINHKGLCETQMGSDQIRL